MTLLPTPNLVYYKFFSLLKGNNFFVTNYKQNDWWKVENQIFRRTFSFAGNPTSLLLPTLEVKKIYPAVALPCAQVIGDNYF